MKEDIKALLSEGYCRSLSHAGPFIVGEDFEAPGPAGRILPKINIDEQTWDKLWSFVANGIDTDESSDAEIFEGAVKRTEFENGVREAVSWYVSDRQFQAEIPDFRRQLQGLRGALERLKSALPDETSSLEHFLSKTYTGEAFIRDPLRPSERQLGALQDSWRERVGFLALEDTLDIALRNIETARLMIGNRKPPQHQIKTFTRSLAKVWKTATGVWPKSGRDPIKTSQSGPFADFVRATNTVVPKPFRIVALDRAIRATCEAADRP